jgi:hypothetical protein
MSNKYGLYFKQFPFTVSQSYLTGIEISDTNQQVTISLYNLKSGLVPKAGVVYAATDCNLLDQQVLALTDLFTNGVQGNIFGNAFGKMTPPITDKMTHMREGFGVLGLYDAAMTYSSIPIIESMASGTEYCLISAYPIVSSMPFQTVPFVSNDPADVYSAFFTVCPPTPAVTPVTTFHKKIVTTLDQNDCLAKLDAQVALLTKVVVALLGQATPAQLTAITAAIPELTAITAAFATADLTAIKSVDNCITEMNGIANIRILQSQYYALKAAATTVSS